ncbi:MAG TPA: hypothetical protein VNE41_04230 [Chitinophagaceae bacterium]|nr:hypothetical protein [Chitinophagaceae bacterium]
MNPNIEQDAKRNCCIAAKMSRQEYEEVNRYLKKTTCRTLSDYVRKVLLNHPVTVNYRNRSADEVLEELIRMKNELAALGSQFSRSVEKMRSMEQPAEIKAWILLNEQDKETIFGQMAEIKSRMHQLYEHVCQHTPDQGN